LDPRITVTGRVGVAPAQVDTEADYDDEQDRQHDPKVTLLHVVASTTRAVNLTHRL